MTSPTSSQSFWAEAVALAAEADSKPPINVLDQREPPLGAKRSSDNAGSTSTSTSPTVTKRARFASPESDDASSRQGQRVYHPSSPTSPFIATESSFISSRVGALGATDHAYLQGAEYAPNAFGDVGDYMRKKNIKVQTQNAQIAAGASDQPRIFDGLTFWINGNTTPSMEELRRMILQRGGVVLPKLVNKGSLDYVIAPVLTLKKFKDLEKGGRLRIVREGFVVQSVQAGRLLDWKNWRLRVDGGGGAMEGFLRSSTRDEVGESGPGEAADDQAATELMPEKVEKQVRHHPMETDEAPTPTPVAATQSLLRPIRPSQRAPVQPLPTEPNTPAPAASTRAALSVANTGSLLQRQPFLSKGLSDPPQAANLVSVEEPADHADDNAMASDQLLSSTTTSPKAKEIAAPARPEGTWTKYYAYDSNRDAARLMQNEDFRNNRTSESGATFINEFYQNSRLHYLSTWKAELRLIVAEARSKADAVPTVLVPEGTHVIFHVDFDAFFVSAGLSTRPHLKGRPVVVCHSAKGGKDSTSEIASASYEARAKGVKNGMSLGRARQLCGDDLSPIPYEFETYKKFSLLFYTVLGGYADELEAVSVDEALLDVTGVVMARALAPPNAGMEGGDPAVWVANKIRDDIRAATGCEVSIGISHNILLAKLATRRAKPAGVFHLSAEGAPELLAPLDVDSLPGVGYSMRRKLADAFGETTCGALLAQSREALRKTLGPKTGDTLYGYLRGLDERRLEADKERKSVSAEINYAIRFQSQEAADTYILELASEVAKRLSAIGARGRHVTLKIMSRHPDAPLEPPKFLGHGKCETANKSATLPRHTAEGGVIGRECVKLLASMRLDPTELRGVGIQVTKLEFGGQPQGVKGQTMLSFAKPAASPQNSGKVAKVQLTAEDAMPEALVRSPLPGAVSPKSPQSLPNSPSPDVPATQPSSDHIDPDFLAALPPELRREVIEEHQAERTRRREASREASVPAQATAVTRNPAAHITKQLRPKLKTQLKASEIAELPLYNAWARAGDRSRSASVAPVEVGDRGVLESPIGGFAPSELRELGIDVDVFAVLPPEVQQESVAAERTRRARTVVFKRASPARELPCFPAPVANRVSRPALFGARETGDVARVLALWVESRDEPAERDVSKVLGYLCKCVVGGLGGIEHVTTLLRGLRGLLMDREGDVGEWWRAWEGLRAGVDAVLVERMGAGLRL